MAIFVFYILLIQSLESQEEKLSSKSDVIPEKVISFRRNSKAKVPLSKNSTLLDLNFCQLQLVMQIRSTFYSQGHLFCGTL